MLVLQHQLAVLHGKVGEFAVVGHVEHCVADVLQSFIVIGAHRLLTRPDSGAEIGGKANGGTHQFWQDEVHLPFFRQIGRSLFGSVANGLCRYLGRSIAGSKRPAPVASGGGGESHGVEAVELLGHRNIGTTDGAFGVLGSYDAAECDLRQWLKRDGQCGSLAHGDECVSGLPVLGAKGFAQFYLGFHLGAFELVDQGGAFCQVVSAFVGPGDGELVFTYGCSAGYGELQG